MVKRVINWLAVLAWMALIFYLSGRTGLRASSDVTMDLVFRKIAHMAEYAILQILLYRAYGRLSFDRSLLTSIGFAFTDEIHQMFVPTRGSALRDVAIDIFGILLGCLFLYRLRPVFGNPRQSVKIA